MITANYFMRSMRGIARHVALNGLSAWEFHGPRAVAPAVDRVHLLLLHHVFADEIGAFRRMLETLANGLRFISYSEAVTRILENRIDDKYIAFSFDDGLRCCLQAADVLDEFGARACFFVCPALVGENNRDVVARFCRERLHQPPLEFLNWNDVEQLVSRGHEIGGHTMRHINLNRVNANEAREEIHQTHAALCARLGAADHFAWPYGRFSDINRAAVRAVFDAGFRSCGSGVRGCYGSSGPDSAGFTFCNEQLCLRRESIAVDWPPSHVNYFLRKSARRPLAIHQTWPASLCPVSNPDSNIQCTSPSMPYRSSRAAA
jgi:peptidoglycan/xylan/chitin deacetylase (PgdA/CDA1 family)